MSELISPAEDMVLLLESQGLTGVFYSHMPDDPPAAIAVLNRAGVAPDFNHDDTGIEKPRVQVMVRDVDHPKAWLKASQAWKILKKRNFSIGDNRYLSIQPIDSIADLGKDERNRRLVGFNIQTLRAI